MARSNALRLVHSREDPLPYPESSTPLSPELRPVIHRVAGGDGPQRPPDGTYPQSRATSLSWMLDLRPADCPDGWGPGAEPTEPEEAARHRRLRNLIDQDMDRLHVVGRDTLFRQYELAELALAVRYVEDALRSRQRIKSAGGLLIWQLEHQTGRKVRR